MRAAGYGRIVNVSVSISPVKDKNGQIIGASTIARDITERKQMIDSLKASEERYRTLIETINTGIFMSTLDGQFLQVNSAVVEMSGYASVEELLQIPMRNIETLRNLGLAGIAEKLKGVNVCVPRV